MKTRKGMVLIAMSAVIIIGFFIGVLMVELQSKILAAIFFLWGLVGSWAIFQFRCPNCNTPMIYNGHIGVLPIYSGFIGDRCQQCGFSFTSKK